MTDLELLAALKTAILTALLDDAATPFVTYNIDGQSVTRKRAEAMDMLKQINELIAAEEPYEIRSATI